MSESLYQIFIGTLLANNFVLAMFLGRIELFTFLVLFTRTFWRK